MVFQKLALKAHRCPLQRSPPCAAHGMLQLPARRRMLRPSRGTAHSCSVGSPQSGQAVLLLDVGWDWRGSGLAAAAAGAANEAEARCLAGSHYHAAPPLGHQLSCRRVACCLRCRC